YLSMRLRIHGQLWLYSLVHDEIFHYAANLAYQRRHNRVTELLIGLGIGDRDPERIGISHQAGALPGREASWIAFGASHEDLRSILVIPRGKRARNAVRTYESKTKAIALCPMVQCILLQVVPQLVGEDILGVYATICHIGLLHVVLWLRCTPTVQYS